MNAPAIRLSPFAPRLRLIDPVLYESTPEVASNGGAGIAVNDMAKDNPTATESNAPEADANDAAEVERKRQWFIGNILERKATSIKESLVQIAVRGVAEGLVRYDEASGFAIAVQSQAERDLYENERDASNRWSLPREASEWLTLYDRRQDLEFVLRFGDVQLAALQALGAIDSTASPSLAMFEWMTAIGLRDDIELAATGHVTAPVRERLGDILKRIVIARAELTSVASWAVALEHFLGSPNWLSEDRKPISAKDVLWNLSLLWDELPSCFKAPTDTAIQKADRFLATLAVDTLRRDVQPQETAKPYRAEEGARVRRRPLSPWGAARGFAACFGHELPQKRRDAGKKGRKK